MMRSLVLAARLGATLLAPTICAADALSNPVGQPVSLAWDPNPESTVLGYVVYVGTAPSRYDESYDAGNRTTFTYASGVAGTRYYFAVAAYAAGPTIGPRSAEISTVIAARAVGGDPGGSGGGAAGTPDSAVFLQPPQVRGTWVTVTWAPTGTLQPHEYLVEVGATSGASNIFNGSVGLLTEITGHILPGTYFVRVRARTSATSSVVSNETTFTVGYSECRTPPATPTGVTGQVANGSATVSWQAVPDATAYLVQAGTAPGQSDVIHADVGPTTSVTAPVPPGFRAYVRVVALNPCGQSAASTEILVR